MSRNFFDVDVKLNTNISANQLFSFLSIHLAFVFTLSVDSGLALCSA
ncbi:hypothetical protein DsansV1_C27g0203621 [Dioscorea sansibarensis]